MSYTNSDLAQAFPTTIRHDALQVASALPQPSLTTNTFSVRVAGELVLIPYRIYHDPALIDPAWFSPLQLEVLDCLLTRHHSGFVREEHLVKIICSNHEWIPPFVVQLAAEYVLEILRVIRGNVHNLDPQLCRSFLMGNPAFLAITKQRITSYWNCYHRWQPREDYAGFQIIEFFERLVARNN
jgi:hypothetical protein